MSSGKTSSLQLNQWQADDDFLMEEFNADNRKIDAALAAEKSAREAAVAALPYVKLMSITTSADAASVSLDVSGIDFTKYAAVHIIAEAVARDSSNTLGNGYKYPFIAMTINGIGGTFDVEGSSNNASYGYVARAPQAYYSNCSMQITVSGFYAHPSATNGSAYYHTLAVQCAAASSAEPVKTVSACQFGGMYTKIERFVFYAGATDSTDFKIKAKSKFYVYGVKL